MQLRRLTVMALALGGLSLPARAQDVIRLFAPVPAGKIAPLAEPLAGRAAPAEPRALVVHAVPAIRGSLNDGEPAGVSTSRARPVDTPWLVAPQNTPAAAPKTANPPEADWQAITPRSSPPPRIIRNAAR